MAAAGEISQINIRPVFYSSAGQLAQGVPLGLVATGSQIIFGKVVSIDEVAIPPGDLLKVLFGFVAYCLKLGSLIPDRETFSLEGEDWKAGVIHGPAQSADGDEMVRIKVLSFPQYGIRDVNGRDPSPSSGLTGRLKSMFSRKPN